MKPASTLKSLTLVVLGFASPCLATEPPAGLSLVEALSVMLERDPNVGLAQLQVDVARGALERARGAFDLQLGASFLQRRTLEASLGEADDAVWSWSSEGSVGRSLRSGTRVDSSVEMSRIDETGSPAINLGSVSLDLRQPLLRDRGRAAFGAQELAAERSLAAAESDRHQRVAERVAFVARGYWSLVSSQANLEVQRGSLERSRRLLETTRVLVEADFTAAAELVQLEADLAAKESSVLRGERDFFTALRELGRDIGLSIEEARALGGPADMLPEPASGRAAWTAGAGDLIALALSRREDLAAARYRLEAARQLESAARNALLPRLDLLLNARYEGIAEGSSLDRWFSSLTDNVPGAAGFAGFSFTWPYENRAARGAWLQARAVTAQNELLVELKEKEIATAVESAANEVSKNLELLEKTQQAVALFEVAVSNEEKKLRAGRSTLINVITQQDRLTSAQQQVLSARFALALAILDLRFASGSLVSWRGSECILSRETFFNIDEDSGT